MKRKTGILGILIAIVIIGIGYAAISAIPLVINGNGEIIADQSSFDVKYTACQNVAASTTEGVTATCTANNTTTATFTVSGMTKKDDTATFTFTISNLSPDLSASIAENNYITNSNTEYFSVTPGAFTTTTVAAGQTTTQTVTVTALKTPITDDEEGSFTLTLSATPVQPS